MSNSRERSRGDRFRDKVSANYRQPEPTITRAFPDNPLYFFAEYSLADMVKSAPRIAAGKIKLFFDFLETDDCLVLDEDDEEHIVALQRLWNDLLLRRASYFVMRAPRRSKEELGQLSAISKLLNQLIPRLESLDSTLKTQICGMSFGSRKNRLARGIPVNEIASETEFNELYAKTVTELDELRVCIDFDLGLENRVKPKKSGAPLSGALIAYSIELAVLYASILKYVYEQGDDGLDLAIYHKKHVLQFVKAALAIDDLPLPSYRIIQRAMKSYPVDENVINVFDHESVTR